MKLNSFSSTVLFLGAIAPAALAQNAPSNIVATDGTSVPARAAVPAPVASVLPTATQSMIELSFQDVDVAELLSIIAKRFDVQVVISGDVSGNLRSINLSNKTPEAAIRHIVNAANLKYRKLEDGTYLIGKNLPEPKDGQILTDIRELNPARGKNLPQGLDNPDFVRSALPSLGGEDSFSLLPANTDIPSLIGNTNLAARKGSHMIRVRNVPPKLMAHWLDPAHNAAPLQLQISADTQKQYGEQPMAKNALGAADDLASEGGNPTPATSFSGANSSFNPYTQRSNAELRSSAQFGAGGGGGGGGGGGAGTNAGIETPEGVERIIAIDAQNSLLVFGTDEGIRSLQEIITFLDRPLKQVEIEAQFVTVSVMDSNIFGIDFTANRNNFTFNNSTPAANLQTGGVNIGFVGPNFRATLSTLVSQNRAKVITAPRVTAINNLTASLSSTVRTPIILTSVSQNINGNQTVAQRIITISSVTSLVVTPTINADDTVTVVMQPTVTAATPSGLLGFASIPVQTVQRVATIANVRDGDTIAIGGLRGATTTRVNTKIPILGDLPILGSLFRSRSNIENDSELIIFLTARIVRRAGDEEAVPGT